jgi:DNA-binding MarR family transcriptional regulator
VTAPSIPEKHNGELDDRGSVRLWLRLLSCAMTIEKIVRRRLEVEFGTTLPRFDVLAALERNDGMTMGSLSRALLVSNGNVTGVVKALAEDGLVTVEALAHDRRSSLARLTPAGRSHFAGLARAHHDWIDELMAGVPADEREHLYRALGRLKLSLGAAAEQERP